MHSLKIHLRATMQVCTCTTHTRQLPLFLSLTHPSFSLPSTINLPPPAIVPATITLQFALVGLGLLHDPDTVASMSRTGNPRELLYGPLTYGIIFVLSTVVYWGDTPHGITALMLLCVGDGLAAVVPRFMPTIARQTRWPHNKNKTMLGSLVFFVTSVASTYALITLFSGLGWFGPMFNVSQYLYHLILLAALCTAVESLPIREFDNLTVFITAVLTDYVFGL
jgi:phytol kinase